MADDDDVEVFKWEDEFHGDGDDNFEWVDEDEGYSSYEVSRFGETVFLTFSKISGETQAFGLTPEDAVTVGMALAQAGQEEST